MRIQNKPTPNTYELHGTPKVLVLHTTAGAFEGAVEWLRMTPEERKKKTGTASYSSAHAVFDRTDRVAKLADAGKATWHAGAVYNPSPRAKAVLPKDWLGRLKNPNRYTIGLEVASGYDIDQDGVLETWEKLYTPTTIKTIAEYIIKELEPEIERIHGEKVTFGPDNTLTHRDITSYKPDLEKQRTMVLAELAKQRKAQKDQEQKDKAKQIKEHAEAIIKLTT